MKSFGIIFQLTPPYTPQHNGVPERRNQTLLDMVRSMMNLITLPKSFWKYALETAARILNIVPTKKVDRTPYKIWHKKAPKFSYLRVWGCEALVKRDKPDKLDSRSIKCIFIGYPKETMGYYFYYPLENKIFVSRNAEFFKNSFMVQEASGSHKLLEMSGSDKGIEIIQKEDTQPSENTSKAHNEVAPIKKFRMENSKKGYTPMMENPDYRKSQGAKIPIESFQQNPGEIHRIVVKTILKYLRNTKDMVIVYGDKHKDELKVSCYADLSFQTNKDDTITMVIVYGAKPNGAKHSKAEYIAAAKASIEVVWMRKFINGIGGVMPSNKRPMEILCDNEPALAITSDPRILKGVIHFQRKYHYIREVIQEGEIVLKKVYIDDNVVDPFTKPVPLNKHFEHAIAIGIVIC
nr:retrovirus-related Pol polyprotein from transposon TNT 1-94 [Tanacetum cinerariifolium]